MSSEIPKGWESTTLVAACEFFTDGDWVESKDQNPDGEVRLIQLADIGDGAFLDKSSRFLTSKKARDLRCSLLAPDDLLIARMADPIARCCLFPGLDQPAATVVDVTIARARNGVDQTFLSYAVSTGSFRELALGAASGTTRSRISRSNLGALPILLPPLDEQRRIAEVLRSVDEAHRLNGLALTHLRLLRKLALRDLFTAPDREEFEDTILGPLPRGWAAIPAEDICEAVIDCKNRTPPITETGFAVVRTPNVRDGRFVRHNLVRTDPDSFEEWTRRGRPNAGDVLITREAPIGEVCAVPDDEPICLGQRMMLYRPNPTKLDSSFLLYALQSEPVQDHLRNLGGGSTVGHVRVGDIRQLPIPCPPLATQIAVAKMLEEIDVALDRAAGSFAQTADLKNSLASDLLSGRVRVPA